MIMIHVIIFDVEGTLYNETDVKMPAGLSTARVLCDRSEADVDSSAEQADSILMVRNNPGADIRGGNRAGIRTTWLRRGKYH